MLVVALSTTRAAPNNPISVFAKSANGLGETSLVCEATAWGITKITCGHTAPGAVGEHGNSVGLLLMPPEKGIACSEAFMPASDLDWHINHIAKWQDVVVLEVIAHPSGRGPEKTCGFTQVKDFGVVNNPFGSHVEAKDLSIDQRELKSTAREKNSERNAKSTATIKD